MAVTLYVLRSRGNKKRYVGITNDLPRQLREDAAGRTKTFWDRSSRPTLERSPEESGTDGL